MNKKLIILLIVLSVVLFLFKNRIMELYSLVSNLLAKFEGFSSKPYWDVRQYTWGYGTKVPAKFMGADGKPKPGITINKLDAMADAWQHIQDDKQYLSKLVKVSLTTDQWAALLSFAYNEGSGNADNLVPNINAKKWLALETQWKLYNKVLKNGSYVVSQDLVKRRASEWELFSSSLN
jgi:GH24 family phage-related lysozyme (muramidase)